MVLIQDIVNQRGHCDLSPVRLGINIRAVVLLGDFREHDLRIKILRGACLTEGLSTAAAIVNLKTLEDMCAAWLFNDQMAYGSFERNVDGVTL